MQNPWGARAEHQEQEMYVTRGPHNIHSREQKQMHLPLVISHVRRRCICVCVCLRAGELLSCGGGGIVSREHGNPPLRLISRSFSSHGPAAAQKKIQSLSTGQLLVGTKLTLSINLATLMQSYCLICMVIDGGASESCCHSAPIPSIQPENYVDSFQKLLCLRR